MGKIMRQTMTWLYVALGSILLLSCFQVGFGEMGKTGIYMPETNLLWISLLFVGVTAAQWIIYALAKPDQREKGKGVWLVVNILLWLVKAILMYVGFSILEGWRFVGIKSGHYWENFVWTNFHDYFYSAIILLVFIGVMIVAFLAELVTSFAVLSRDENR